MNVVITDEVLNDIEILDTFTKRTIMETKYQDVIHKAYEAFNSRNIDLSLIHI